MLDLYDIIKERDLELEKLEIQIKLGRFTVDELIKVEIKYQEKIEVILKYNSQHDL